ncbi:MAG TPA: tripartite tricarboxylate transporter substrate binding protein [Burkholderiales bacterium]|nr:tripartite tricarboxylate transporter substrate binding protein [Burkholderiales bacterium]
MLKRSLPLLAGAVLLAGTAGAANAQTAASFPVKPVKLVVPFAPGGPNDILARIVGQKWNEAWGHPAIIENRGGAGGTIGVEYGSKAPPDGYTIIMGGMSNLAVAVGMYSKLGYDPHELTPITNIAIVPYVLAVNPRVPAKNVAELIAVAKSKKSLLSYGSSGTGAVSHLAAELFKSMSGTDLVHVPYKGTAPAITDVIAGQIDMMFADYAAIAPHAKVGKLRMLAVAGGKRSGTAPELPTIGESGVKGYAVDAWFGLVAPPGVSKDIVARINTVTVNALKSADVKQRFGELGYEPIGDTPEQFGATIRSDIDKYVRVVRQAGIKAE